MRRVRALVFTCIALLAALDARAGAGPLEIAAFTWLELLDEGRFDEAWREAAPLLHETTTAETWKERMRQLRGGFGPVSSRDGVDRAYHTTLEGAPDGTYFTLRIRTRLADGGERIEIVTLTSRAGSEAYRVAAYGIKR